MSQMEDEVILEEVVEFKVYKEKPYLNSDKEPFGLTINGKSKEYIHAHETFKSMIKKGKQYAIGAGKIKILDVTKNKAMINAIVEVCGTGDNKGNVELKVYNPSLNKKKGATLELRKMSDFEYSFVKKLKTVITALLDRFITGDDIEEVIRNSNTTKRPCHKLIGRITSKPKLFACDMCTWQTKFGSALKAHKTRIHNQDNIQYAGDLCKLEVKNQVDLEKHIVNQHKPNVKRSKLSFKCEIINCESTFDSSYKLKEHEHDQHPKSNQTHLFAKETESPSSSPPRKKQDDFQDNIVDEVEMIDLEIEAKDLISSMLENRIKQLEIKVKELQEQKKIDDLLKQELVKEVITLKSKPPTSSNRPTISKLSNHLHGVKQEHLPDLRGFSLRYKATPDGACLTNCAAVHIYEDEDEGSKLKKRVNHHIADNWENYYINKIAMPYVETVGVGDHVKTVRIASGKEMVDFLRSDEALMVYTNTQELLALANIYNISINIFTYGGSESRWTTVSPDPIMVGSAETKLGGLVPDMFLYHCEDIHYDLLVKNDSRIALLGVLAGAVHDDRNSVRDDSVRDDSVHDDSVHVDKNSVNDDWRIVKNRKRKFDQQKNKSDEKLLVETENKEDDSKDLDEEITLLGSKNSGHRRSGPQQSPEIASRIANFFKCDQCTFEFEKKGQLNAHVETHHLEKIMFNCDACDQDFPHKSDLEKHVILEHSQQNTTDEWNCNDCPFQACSPSELMKHLKTTGHQPSQTIKDKRKVIQDLKQCYTCKMEFDGFYNLMNHRKSVHPSNKKCRNFPGDCKFSSDCWYVHSEQVDVEQSSENFKCNVCDEKFKGRDKFMSHKKIVHPATISTCENFLAKKCQRSDKTCWFAHTSDDHIHEKHEDKSSDDQVFWKAPLHPFPPDQVTSMLKMVKQLCEKVESMEKKLEDLMD